MSITAKPTAQTQSVETEQWNAFNKQDLAESAIAHLASLHLDPRQLYITAREKIYVLYQERQHCTRKQCDATTITQASLIAAHTLLSKQCPSLGLLYTFGYSMPEASVIVEQLVALGVTIYDIRYSPRSRSHKWRKPYLKHLFGDSYVHLPALGNRHYNDDLPIELADPTTGVAQIAQPLLAGKHGALMCVCKKHDECHRWNASEEILKRTPGVILVPLPYLAS